MRTMHLPMLQTTRYRVLPSATTGDVHRSSPGQRLDATSSATKSPSASAGAGGKAKRTQIFGWIPLGTAQRRPIRGQTFYFSVYYPRRAAASTWPESIKILPRPLCSPLASFPLLLGQPSLRPSYDYDVAKQSGEPVASQCPKSAQAC